MQLTNTLLLSGMLVDSLVLEYLTSVHDDTEFYVSHIQGEMYLMFLLINLPLVKVKYSTFKVTLL